MLSRRFSGPVRNSPHGTREHPNRTPFAFAPLFLADEEGRPLLVTVIRATYAITGHSLSLAATQPPIPLGGEVIDETAEVSSFRFEPEVAFFVMVVGASQLGSLSFRLPACRRRFAAWTLWRAARCLSTRGSTRSSSTVDAQAR